MAVAITIFHYPRKCSQWFSSMILNDRRRIFLRTENWGLKAPGTENSREAAPHQRLIQPFLPPEVAERPNIGQRKREPILIFVTHRSQRKTPVFHAQTATVPSVTCLRRRILQRTKVCVDANA